MTVQFSGTFHRAPLQQPKNGGNGVYPGSHTHVLVAQMDEAATSLANRIRTEVPQDFQLSYNPNDNLGSITILEKSGDDYKFIDVRLPGDKYLNTRVSLEENETPLELLGRAIETSKELKTQLDTLRAEKESVNKVLPEVSGWIVPQAQVTPAVAQKMGLTTANALKATLLKLAPQLQTLPEDLALNIEPTYDDANLRIKVVKKENGGTQDFLPSMGIFSGENEVTQSSKFWSPFSFPETSVFSRLNRKETTTHLVTRGIALAHTLNQREKDVAEFKAAYEKALTETHGNFEFENTYIVGTHGKAHAFEFLNALKGASKELYAVHPNLQLKYLPDYQKEGKETLVINYKAPDSDYYYPIFLQTNDPNRSYVSKKLAERPEDFVYRTIAQAKDCLRDKLAEEKLLATVDPEKDTGLKIQG
ncbi:MAG: hypothetical protein K2X66_15895 [Cyanobacteria bacterium]|nr:hypothetical protein [Cyanobacteriota bacterium]